MESHIKSEELTVPEEIHKNWQNIVNIMSEIIDIPAALITKTDPPEIEVLLSSGSDNNPFKAGDRANLTGSYCEEVLKSKDRLLVSNALNDSRWSKNRLANKGMISYLGFPLLWPDCRVFGTICVLDSKENRYSDHIEAIMVQFKELIESHLTLLYRMAG